MKRILWIAAIYLTFASIGLSQSSDVCDAFQQLVKSTYDFKPSKLAPADLNDKSTDMDKVWDAVTTNPRQMLPCLRKALEDPNADAWFLFDGSMLLVQIDPSLESKKIQVRAVSVVDLDDVNLRTWMVTVTARAVEGFDMSEAGAQWMEYPDATYPLPEHAMNVDPAMGALFIYGSMDESIATPALRKIVEDRDHPRRDTALAILSKQATPESLDALKQINTSTKPALVQPRAQPKTTRDEFVKAFEDVLMDDWGPLSNLMDKVPDGEKDVVAVLKPTDLPLLRRVRRRIISTANPHAADYYDSFSQILMTLIWQ